MLPALHQRFEPFRLIFINLLHLHQHIENQRSTAIGSLRFELPPVADISAGTYTDAPPAVKYQTQFPPSRLAISHSSTIEPQTKTNNNYKDISINSNSKLLCQTPPHHHPITQKSKDSGSADSGIWTNAESANIKSQSLLFNPHCDNKSISEFVSQFDTFSPSSADVKFNFILLQLQLQLQLRFPPYSLSHIIQSPIDAIPDIEPEPPPNSWTTYLCSVFIIMFRFRISLWGSNSMSLSFLELSCTHELVNQISRACADCSITSTNMPDAML